MVKLGVFQVEDYFPPSSGLKGRLQRYLVQGRISLQLLRTAIPASPREIEVFEAIMSGLQLNSGVYRTTCHNRFLQLDPEVNALIAEHFPANQPLVAHDWAASDCLTSSEWAASLLKIFPLARLHASDLTLFLVEITAPDGSVSIVERDGKPLQYVSPRLVMNYNAREPRPRIATFLASARAAEQLKRIQSAVAIPASWLDSPEQSLELAPWRLRKLPMVHPEAAAFSRRDPRFSVECHSAFDSLAAPVDVIRSMNIYNLAYFSQDRLAEGARVVWSSLRPGGIWIVGRTWRDHPPASNVSMFERGENGFKLLRRYAEGSEIESLVLAQTWQ